MILSLDSRYFPDAGYKVFAEICEFGMGVDTVLRVGVLFSYVKLRHRPGISRDIDISVLAAVKNPPCAAMHLRTLGNKDLQDRDTAHLDFIQGQVGRRADFFPIVQSRGKFSFYSGNVSLINSCNSAVIGYSKKNISPVPVEKGTYCLVHAFAESPP